MMWFGKFSAVKKCFIVCVLCVTAAVLSSCKYGAGNPFYEGNSVNNRVTELLRITDDPACSLSGKYSVLIFTDRHQGGAGLDFAAVDQKLFTWLDEKTVDGSLPAFAICLGDATDGGKPEQYKAYNEFTKKLQDDYGLVTYTTCGNHDIYQYNWENWQENVYPHTSFFVIKTAGTSYYSLDTATGVLGNNQMDLLKRAFDTDPNPKVIISHYPLYTKTHLFAMEDTVERNNLLLLFEENNVKLYFAGHFHIEESIDFGTFQSYTLPGYTETQTWGILSVDEEKNEYFFEIFTSNL